MVTDTTPSHPRAAAAWLAAFGAIDAQPLDIPFAPATLKQALDAALDVGQAAGRLPEAMRVLADIELRLGSLAATLRIDRRAGTVVGSPPPGVAIVTDLRGPNVVLAGRWVPDLAASAGARALFVGAGGPDVSSLPEYIAGADPERLLFALCDRTVDNALSLVRDALGGALGQGLGGRLSDRITVLDGSRFVNEPGPALARSIELIALACHGAASDVVASPDEMVSFVPAPAVGIGPSGVTFPPRRIRR